MDMKRRKKTYGYFFVSPYLVLSIIFLILPLIMAIYMSFTKYSLLDGNILNARWIGLANYKRAFSDQTLRIAFVNTFKILFIGVPLQILGALVLGLMINSKLLKGKTFFRLAYYIPTLTSTVAVALIFTFLLQKGGLINTLFAPLGFPDINWFDSVKYAIYPIIAMHAWRKTGIYMLIILGGLQTIPESYYEAITLDGGNIVDKLRYVILPVLKPILFFNLVVASIEAFKLFDEAFIVSGGTGGPLNATMTVVVYLYRTAFTSMEMGYASAIAMILFVVIFTLAIIQRKLQGEEIKM